MDPEERAVGGDAKDATERVTVRLESPEKSEAFLAGWDAGHRAAFTKFSYMLFGMYIASLMYITFKYVRSGE